MWQPHFFLNSNILQSHFFHPIKFNKFSSGNFSHELKLFAVR